MRRSISKKKKQSHAYRSSAHRCPVCRRYEFSSKCSFDVCPICGWIDDAYQEELPDEDCCANAMSLNEAKNAYEELCKKYSQKYPILEASHHNWSLVKGGDWEQSEWVIYCDGTFLRRSYYIMTPEEVKNSQNKGIFDRTRMEHGLRHIYAESGKMSMPKFSELLDAMEKSPWRPDGELIRACDGDAWKFQQFDMTSKTVKDSGPIGYIYGNRVLEGIANLLP